ncbi:hypothetical protein [Crocosphaera sp.]|uniref:hypothetical protein n=1 Tax=Crocosphaera sp. TaxID=2729996 RepID=UPI00261EA406|nr:hypothetical protein [Crocosphaera sp.]MDJ0579517.1 hypothetical protein [Crocosphaera sp.]
MNAKRLEIWALNVIDLVKSGKTNEDDLVEFKTELPELPKKNRKNDPKINEENAKAKKELSEIARRIAGHANAARGEDILWLIGINEKSETNKIPGFNNNIEFANWYPYIQKYFIELAPKLTIVNVPIDEKVILALGFETDRSPFVVKNQKDSNFCEVPWREESRTRSARRSDLILLLSPIEKLPDIEIVNKEIKIKRAGKNKKDQYGNYNVDNMVDVISVEFELYITPKYESIFAIPFHRFQGTASIQKLNKEQNIDSNSMSIESKGGRKYPCIDGIVIQNLTMKCSANEMIINGPGMVTLSACLLPFDLKKSANYDVDIEIKLFTTISDHPVIVKTTLPYPWEQDTCLI